MNTIPLSALIAASAALNAIVADHSSAIPYALWRQCLDARTAFCRPVEALLDAIAPVEVTPPDIDALQTAAFAEGFDQAIEQGEAVAS